MVSRAERGATSAPVRADVLVAYQLTQEAEVTIFNLQQDQRVYALNERGEWEDCWIIQVDFISNLVQVDFANGDEPQTRFADELQPPEALEGAMV